MQILDSLGLIDYFFFQILHNRKKCQVIKLSKKKLR